MRDVSKILFSLMISALVALNVFAMGPELLIGISEFTHGKSARAMAFSPFGDAVMTVAENEARLWEISSSKNPLVFKHSKNIIDAAFDPAGSWVVAADEHGEVITWDLGTGTGINSKKIGKSVSAISVSKTGEYYAVSSGREVFIFESKFKTQKWKFLFTQEVNSLDFAPVGNVLAVGVGSRIYLKDLDKQNHSAGIIQSSQAITNISFSNHGDMITGVVGNFVFVWDSLTSAVLAVLPHYKIVSDASFAPDNDELVTASGREVIFWDIPSGKINRRFVHPDEVESIAVSPSGNMILSGTNGAKVRLWRIVK